MSRRPAPGADRAAQNQQTLKSLVKLEANKSCADCKRNKHPRWASWNLGVFVCIRCSGIHRGMGTHISRVKSVDLDSWTDEQLQSMLRWGNARANKYWEAKLAPGHVPSESKIENFIRTKYESKRWVMDGGMPDPATLDAEGDDDVPLNVVQEKAKLERSASQRAAASSAQPRPTPAVRRQNIDLFGDDPAPVAAPPRPSTTGPSVGRPLPPKAEPAPPKQTKPGDSLLGLDFFGPPQSAPPSRPATTANPLTSTAPSRPDLKQSILSLYASTPKPTPQPQAQHGHSDSFGGLQSSGVQSPSSGLRGLNDAFSSLNFSSTPAPTQPKPSPFADLIGASSSRTTAQTTMSPNIFGSGGGFFDTVSKPAAKPTSPPAHQRTFSPNGGLSDFSSSTSPSATSASSKPTPGSSGMGDLFDLSMPTTQTSPPIRPTAPSIDSAFNLSAPVPSAQQKPVTPAAPSFSSNLSNMDAWGSSDAWASSNTTTTTTKSPVVDDFGGWGSSVSAAKPTSPQITQDDDFGGWSSAAPAPTTATSKPAAKPLSGADDLFSNVWE